MPIAPVGVEPAVAKSAAARYRFRKEARDGLDKECELA
jgi:hypothetical protein